MKDTAPRVESLSDDELIAETKRLVAAERVATAALLRSLMEIDTRRLYLREGCSSLFTYCTHILHLAEGAAYNRIEAARAARRFPDVLDALTRGRSHRENVWFPGDGHATPGEQDENRRPECEESERKLNPSEDLGCARVRSAEGPHGRV